MRRLQDKVAIVTGAGSGQGAEEARLLAELGAKVVATDINRESLEGVVEDINRVAPGSAIAVVHDVSSGEAWSGVVSTAVDRFGSVTVLVNNAGIHAHVPFEDLTLDQWQQTMNVNAWSVFAGMQAVVPAMRNAGGGSIVTIASSAAISAVGGFSAYTASKGAVDALTRGAAMELAPDNIRVNCINPGVIRTAIVERSLSTETALAAAASAIPLGRLGSPRDVAYLVAHLASDEASFTTGASFVIDGGNSVEGGLARLRERVGAARAAEEDYAKTNG